MKVIKLNSVGCVINQKGIIYPELKKGGFDKKSGFHVNEINNNEFFEKCNKKDLQIIEKYYRSKNGTYKNL
tara:strand:+ start:227 stop:439 length:213 start_codon:yes stop_codon:yes gene_type:complete